MIKIFFIAFFSMAISTFQAQEIKVYHEEKEQGFVFYSDNNEMYPVSISLDFKVINLIFSEVEKTVFVIPPKTKRFKIGELNALKPTRNTEFSYRYTMTMGDVTMSNYESSYEYDLPFSRGNEFEIFQGYNGKFSHQNENSLDFSMPEGTEILSAREGKVVELIQNNTRSCPREECNKYNNYITIMHADGSFAQYTHIKTNSSRYKIGDDVKKGEVIAYSGNVGWTSGPHLHFVCFLGRFGKWKTLETKFRINKGDQLAILKEGNVYRRDY